MKIWEKVKYPLLTALIGLLLAFIRYLALAVPSWVNATFLYPLLVVRIFSRQWFHTDILLDVLLVAVGLWAVMLVPAPGEREKCRRYLLRPAITLAAALLLSNWAVAANDEWEDRLYQRQQDATYAAIHAFVETADEAYAYNTHSQHSGARFREEFPQLMLMDHGSYFYSDYIFIDYDTQRIGLAYHRHGTLRFYEYQLKSVETCPDLPQQQNFALSAPGEALVSYCPSGELSQYTDGFALIMADGSVYAINGRCRGENLFLGLNSAVKRMEDF